MSRVTLAPLSPKGTKFSFEQKEEAVKTWLATGNLRIAASVVGCTIQTIESWKKQDWWKDIVSSARAERALVLDNKMSKLVDKSMELIEDRLHNGDFVLNNKTGQIVRKPVALKDLTQVSNTLLTRQHVLEQALEGGVERNETQQEMLAALAKEFASWARNKQKSSAETIEYKDVDNALYDEEMVNADQGTLGEDES